MNKYFILFTFITSSIVYGMDGYKIDQSKILAPSDYGQVDLYYNGKNFSLYCDGEKQTIHNYDVDPLLRKLDEKKIMQFLKAGSIKISKYDNGEFSIKSLIKGLGGGPVTAAAAYWLTKTVCYGVAIGGATTAITTVAPMAAGAGPVLAMGLNLATGGASLATTTIGAGIGASTTLGGPAAMATTGVLSGGIVEAVAAVEGASNAAFLIGLWLPLP